MGVVVALASAWLAGRWTSNGPGMASLGRTLAISWASKAGAANTSFPAIYGAHVYAEPAWKGGFEVRCVVYIGQPGFTTYFDDYGVVGTAATWEQAVQKFSVITWTPTNLLVGSGLPTDKAVATRASIEQHR